MRVLLMAFPTRTHIYSLAPLGWALRAAGHEVRFVGRRNPSEVGSYLETGLDTMWFGPELDIPRHRKLGGDDRNPMDGEFKISETREEKYTEEYVRETYERWTHVFGWASPPQLLDELARFARRWKPDLVVWDPMVYAGPLIARVTGAAHLRVMYAADQTARISAQFQELRASRPEAEREPDPLVEWMDGWLGKHGESFDEELRFGMTTLDPQPACVRFPLDVAYRPVRFVPVNRPLSIPRWVVERPARPRVMLTLGVSNRQVLGQEEASVTDLLNGLAELDIEVVATLTAEQLASVEKVPDNVHAVDFVPMNELLPTCAAIVHQGGGATIGNAGVHGVPQLIVPGTTWSERASALALAKQGSGLFVDLEDITPAAIRTGVARLVEEPSFADAAGELRREMTERPTFGDIVPELEAAVAAR
ncbi:DUF1205 domain-containing protein [Streptomyces sp. M2CJ-2]|uniref:nucleotide disphospho-sugar-binding domain-containing protein n=1 Tax=Streptomyces sp. M2CJ-2 TaxID=2803948 RepID=UPI0019296A68|nr:nucleotide disphospho-sugar-binding domain-containing protein [Streptomyces sp. M2CJ-2]MBL3671357.1 DUF1205 domain-containing protein [Streptomyces sp. M2CJ-2]